VTAADMHGLEADGRIDRHHGAAHGRERGTPAAIT
jgi:hypothetical protein